MIVAKVEVSGVKTKVVWSDILTAGMVGAKVEFVFKDPQWDSLHKLATFLCGYEKKDALFNGNVAEIPPEVLKKGRRELYVGLYGHNADDELCLPTLWVSLGEVRIGSDPSGDPSTDPSLPVWAQLQGEVSRLDSEKLDADKLPEAVNDALAQAKESGEFKGNPGKPGFSPTVAVEDIDGGHRVTIADKDGSKIFSVMDGADGEPGKDASPIIADASGDVITLTDSLEQPLKGLTLYGKTVQNGTPSPTAPVALESVGDDGSVVVASGGKNLLPITATSKKDTGVTFTVNTDGSITANGTATAGLWFTLNRTVVLPNGNYILSGCSGGAGDTYSLYVDVDGNNTFCLTKEVNFTIADPVSVKVVILVKEGKTVSETFYPMIRKATVTDATYEPYKEPQTLALSMPNGLHGIPVTSGGNHTDDSGQQRICAEIDLARGKRVQRVVPTELTGSEYGWSLTSTGNCLYWDYEADYSDLNTTLYTGGYCNQYPNVFARPANSYEYCHAWYGAKGGVRRHMFKDSRYTTVAEWKAHLAELYAAGTPIVVLSVPVTPIETDLTAEELADFTALLTNYPNTTIFNDANAGMAVKYAADTKLYIDKKFAELAAAIVNNA